MLQAGEGKLYLLIQQCYKCWQELQRELEANQGEVLTLRETAEQLLVSGESPEMAAARDKTRIIANRLRTLLHLTSSYIESLETKLGVKVNSTELYRCFEV